MSRCVSDSQQPGERGETGGEPEQDRPGEEQWFRSHMQELRELERRHRQERPDWSRPRRLLSNIRRAVQLGALEGRHHQEREELERRWKDGEQRSAMERRLRQQTQCRQEPPERPRNQQGL